ncbi:TPA: hypothetical protein RQL24_003427 [Vibrio vulnificus]|uniref:hypothetical protein n=1 Tax=Vibrio vulnificus TaxID=672 RepID=UPI001FAF17FC|nr:hypothetical protein [Vibrio vulnificus]MCJ0804016.1 hypothetical protein [Vibrio vulnificus]HDY7487914.1 hypothetical protein [Vibrio vulnificus]HDY8080531.1 hypothetical protein [Vibrio vulnificus]HDY8191318.1 hypothetical protein [Vibrio vulnificus]
MITKHPKQEISEVLMANAGNRLTPELIVGLQARINHVIDSLMASQPKSENSEKQDD